MQEGFKKKILSRAYTAEKKVQDLEKLIKLHLPDSEAEVAIISASVRISVAVQRIYENLNLK